MKKFLVILAALSAMCLCSIGCKKIVPVVELPQSTQVFLQTHFAGTPVSFATSELGEYEIFLDGGAELEFKKSGEWKTIDMEHSVVPESIVATLPQGIPAYIETCCPGVPVTKLKKGFWYGYKVELANDMELVFNSKGTSCRIDD